MHFLLSLFLLTPNLVLVETIIQTKVEPLFIEQSLSYYLKPFFDTSFFKYEYFLEISAHESSFFA